MNSEILVLQDGNAIAHHVAEWLPEQALGEDGHTASLFPGVGALGERSAWTAAVVGAKPEPRLTLTYPASNSSGVVAFLVSGAGKRDILARAMTGDGALPAVHVVPIGKRLLFTDQAAAAH